MQSAKIMMLNSRSLVSCLMVLLVMALSNVLVCISPITQPEKTSVGSSIRATIINATTTNGTSMAMSSGESVPAGLKEAEETSRDMTLQTETSTPLEQQQQGPTTAGSAAAASPTVTDPTLVMETNINTTTTSTTTATEEDGDPRPRNMHVAFIGDSVSRYQYISLAWFLKTGEWLREPADNDNSSYKLLYGATGASWDNFFAFSNNILQPEEKCDCHRHKKNSYHDINENRYFVETTRNNSLTFIAKFGMAPAHGHWIPPIDHHANSINLTVHPPYEWDGYSWDQVVTDHLAQLAIKPQFILFNAGLHVHDLANSDVQQFLLQAFHQTGIVGIYRTTTRTQLLSRSKRFSRGAHDNALCGKVFPNCLNVDWTGDLIGPDYYYDDPHLKTAGNNLMNQQLLSYLQDFRGGVSEIAHVDPAQLLSVPNAAMATA